MSRRLVQCRFCGAWIYFERNAETGWTDAKNPDGTIHRCGGAWG